MVNFASNPAFTKEHHSDIHNVSFYAPVDLSTYHTSRFIAAQAQDRFSAMGITPDRHAYVLNEILERLNSDKPSKTWKTDIAGLIHLLQSMQKYPVDELCAIRMGAIFSFMDGEDPNKTDDFWTRKKTEMALTDPDLYTFFLSKGLANTPAYSSFLDTLTATEMEQRQEMIMKQTAALSVRLPMS